MLAVTSVLVLLTLTSTVTCGGHCGDNWLDCGNGKCVSELWLCDGDNDCGNRKDEENCGVLQRRPCMSSQFQCASDGLCIPDTWLCDGEHDCQDISDENQCGANHSEECVGFRCGDNRCIPEKWRCDGNRDCKDGSDEEPCPSRSGQLCSEAEFACATGGECLNRSLVCDGHTNCTDGSDEGDHCGDSCSNSTCSQECQQTPSGPKCSCRDGYSLDAKDNSTCVDVDECQLDGSCSQVCTNQDGGFKCSCLDGYELVNDTVCVAKGADPLLLFATVEDIRGFRIRSQTYFPVRRAAVRASSVDSDPVSQRVFWTEPANLSAVYSCKLDGSDLRTVLSHGLHIPEDIAVDPVARNLYITDSGLRQVLACKMDGSMCTVLHSSGILKPRSLALDPQEGLLYWSDWSEEAAGIYRSGMDGTQRVALVSQNISWPNGIAVDRTTGRLFWADAKRKTIESIALDGSARKEVLGGSVFHPFSLTVFEDHLYWTDWATFSLESCNKFTGHKMTLMIRENGKHIMGVHAYHPVLVPRAGNPCWSSVCSHMCLISPSSRRYRCACPTGFSLAADERTCKMDYEYPSLFVSEGSSVYHLRPDAVGSGAVTELPLPLRSALVSRVAYDAANRLLFVADLSVSAIHVVNMTSLHTWYLVKNHTMTPEDLAFDATSNALFWVDSSKGTVEVVSVALKRRAVLVEGLKGPAAIAVSRSGHMFVATVGLHSITMYDLDGKNPRLLKEVSGFPLSLAVHPTQNRLYWADPVSMTVSSLVYSPLRSPYTVANRLEGVLSVAASEDSLFWTVSRRELHILKSNATRYLHLPGQSKGVVSRKVTYSPGVVHAGISPCSVANGGCGYLCLSSLRGKVCVCPYGMVLSADNLTCAEGGCSPEDFRCARSGRCLPAEFRCDGSRDCEDGEDEIGCESFCSGDDFKCSNGRCIIKSWKCDRRDDCGDNSDEENCPEVAACADGQFPCGNGECIPSLWRCDGQPDCADASDETGCEAAVCDPESQLRCDNGQCVPLSWVCDGAEDCVDGRDEENCAGRSARTCSALQFRCESDGACIDAGMRCDRRHDCEDGSDERNCSGVTAECKAGFFQCDDGACIYGYERCDGHGDCAHSEDEAHCNRTTCLQGEVPCPDRRRCILQRWVCDGDEDCEDGSDERNCDDSPRPTDPPRDLFREMAASCEEFVCYKPLGCLPWSRVCDGVQDCSEISDEGGACKSACQAPDRGGCAQVCHKTPKGSQCSCYKGYRLLPDNRTCTDVDECATMGSCSHFCNNTKGGFKCACAEGYALHHDHRRCRADGGPARVLYLLGDQIRGIDLSAQAPQVLLKVDDADMLGMDYDARDNVYYWTEGLDGSINSFSADTHRLDTVVKSPLKPIIVKYDWVAGNLYYTDKAANLGVCSKDGRFCKSLLSSISIAINAMDISPTTGQVFWTTFASPLRKLYSGLVERAEMDGGGRMAIVKDKVNWPAALAVDRVLRHIYWSDVELNIIECADFQGYGRRKVAVRSTGTHRIPYHPWALSVFEDSVYWADWGSDAIVRCNKFNGEECSSLREANVKAEALLVAHRVMQPPGVNYCAESKCPHLCLLRPSGSSCVCADGFEARGNTCRPVLTPVSAQNATSSALGCPREFCLADGECILVDGKFRCRCPASYSGSSCENRLEASSSYDYTWVMAVLFAVGLAAIVILCFLLFRRNRDKLHHVTESVAVKFRRQASGHDGHRLVVDMDDCGACDELDLDGDFKHPFGDAVPADSAYKRWPNDVQNLGSSITRFFGRLGARDAPLCK